MNRPLRYGPTYRSAPNLAALYPPMTIRIPSMANCVFVEVVPESKNAAFIRIPINAAKVVKQPKIKPSPTRNSPQDTKKENTPDEGIATLSKNVAHHPCTAG